MPRLAPTPIAARAEPGECVHRAHFNLIRATCSHVELQETIGQIRCRGSGDATEVRDDCGQDGGAATCAARAPGAATDGDAAATCAAAEGRCERCERCVCTDAYACVIRRDVED
jgi:hypothetical protein